MTEKQQKAATPAENPPDAAEVDETAPVPGADTEAQDPEATEAVDPQDDGQTVAEPNVTEEG